jgi:hypothetical protein
MSSLETNFAPKGRLCEAGKNRLAHSDYNKPILLPEMAGPFPSTKGFSKLRSRLDFPVNRTHFTAYRVK